MRQLVLWNDVLGKCLNEVIGLADLQPAVVIPVAVHLALFGLSYKLFECNVKLCIAALFSKHKIIASHTLVQRRE